MAAPPATKFATICAVTSCGHGVTPWAVTPWSAANTATAAGAGTGGGDTPAIPASWIPTVSSRPSEPRGLVNRSWCAAAARPAAGGPVGELGSGQQLRQHGQGEAVDGPGRRGDVVSDEVAEPQTWAREHLRERAKGRQRRPARGPAPGREGVEGLVPHVGLRV